MSAPTLAERIFVLEAQGFDAAAIAAVLGLDVADVAATLHDPTVQPPPSPGGGGGLVVAGETGDFAAVADHFYYVDATGGPVAATLPVPANGDQVIVKKTDASSNSVTVLPHGAESIDDASSFVIAGQDQAATFVGDGSNWQVTTKPGASGVSDKGAWTALTAYKAGDSYTNAGTRYLVVDPYTSGASFGATDTTNASVLGASSGASLTVNDGPVQTGTVPLAITQQPVTPPSGVIQPLPPLVGFQFPGTPRTFTFATGNTAAICTARDGNVWVTDRGGGQIWRVTPTGTATAFAMTGTPYGICSGSDGNLWVGVSGIGGSGNAGVSRVTLSGVPTDFPLVGSSPEALCAGPDGNVWIADDNSQVWRVAPDGTATAFPVGGGAADFLGICAGPDGNIWTVDQNHGYAYRITPEGVATQIASDPSTAFLLTICAGADGNLWAPYGGAPPFGIVKITPAGDLTIFTFPGFDALSGASAGIASGAGGDLWVAINGNGEGPAGLVKVTPQGVITVFDWTDGDAVTNVPWVCSGPEGSIWISNISGKGATVFPFYVQLGGLLATAVPTADPHVKGVVWANSGVLTLSTG